MQPKACESLGGSQALTAAPARGAEPGAGYVIKRTRTSRVAARRGWQGALPVSGLTTATEAERAALMSTTRPLKATANARFSVSKLRARPTAVRLNGRFWRCFAFGPVRSFKWQVPQQLGGDARDSHDTAAAALKPAVGGLRWEETVLPFFCLGDTGAALPRGHAQLLFCVFRGTSICLLNALGGDPTLLRWLQGHLPTRTRAIHRRHAGLGPGLHGMPPPPPPPPVSSVGGAVGATVAVWLL